MKILICGVGTIGSNVAKNLYLNRELDLILVDRDIVKKENLSVQQFSPTATGIPKADAFAVEIYYLNQNTDGLALRNYDITKYSEEFTTDVEECDLVLDCLDNFQARNILHAAARAYKKPICHLGFSPDMVASVLWNDKYKPQTGEKVKTSDVCNLAEMRWWLLGATALQTMNVLNFLDVSGLQSSILIDRDLNYRSI